MAEGLGEVGQQRAGRRISLFDEVHRVLITKVFPRQAGVMTVDEWTSGLG